MARWGVDGALALLPYQRGFGGYVHMANVLDRERDSPWIDVHDEIAALPPSSLVDLDPEGERSATPAWWYRSRDGALVIPLDARY